MTLDDAKDLIREMGPYLLIAAGVALAWHGRADAGLITGGFGLVQAAVRPTGGSKPDPGTK